MSANADQLDLPIDHLYRPSVIERKAPLLLLLHGYGSNMHDLYGFVPYLSKDFAIVALQAPIHLGGPSYAWYNIYFDQPQGKWNDEAQGKEAVRLILEVLEKIKAQIDIDPAQINLLGFSQGAILSYATAMAHGHMDKVLCLSGYLNEAVIPELSTLNSCPNTRFFISHGAQDQVIPVAWARSTKMKLQELGCKIEYQEFPVGHGVSPENFEALNAFLNQKASF
jgi:phospholipase/carboxylesterase